MLLIWPKGGELFPKWFNKTLRFFPTNLLRLAELTPPEFEVKIVDECLEGIDINQPVDLVGISVLSYTASRAYFLSEEFRKRGAKVVLGGLHVSLMADEAVRHADAIVVGEAESVWRKVLEDFKKGTLQRVYEGGTASGLLCSGEFRRELLSKKTLFSIPTLEATRGCVNHCSFCAIANVYKGNFQCRRIENVIDEVKYTGARFFMFVDDNLTANKEHAKNLFKAIKKNCKVKWICQSSVKVANDPMFLKLMREAGCIAVFIGFESISEPSLRLAHKSWNLTQDYYEAIQSFHSAGLGVWGSFIFGFDADDITIFERTLDFAVKAGIEVASFCLFTPIPGTKIYYEYLANNRIIDNDFRNYDFRHVVIAPAGMTPEELAHGFDWIWKKFYSINLILRRAPKMQHRSLAIPINLAFNLRNRIIKRSTAVTLKNDPVARRDERWKTIRY